MYNWKLDMPKTTVQGSNATLHAAIDQMVYYARGNFVQDFYVNGHHMNEEFDLVIIDGKVLHVETNEEFVPMKKWYDLLGAKETEVTSTSVMALVTDELLKSLRPQPTRGSTPQNPATLMAKGESL